MLDTLQINKFEIDCVLLITRNYLQFWAMNEATAEFVLIYGLKLGIDPSIAGASNRLMIFLLKFIYEKCCDFME